MPVSEETNVSFEYILGINHWKWIHILVSFCHMAIHWVGIVGSNDLSKHIYANGGPSHQYHEAHYSDVIMGAIASQITSLTRVYSIVYSDTDQRKHQSSASLAFVWGIHRWPVNSPHKWPVTRKMFPFDDVIVSFSFRAELREVTIVC